ncbi:hypothetical protein BVY04_02975 [bacterium M21]|nr:hypothetical protein BVY04_02975 [bacterium M21]
MDIKTKELIAVGASVTANCTPCLKYHFQKVREAGATDNEIMQAISVGRMVRKGAAGKWDEEANLLLGEPSSSIEGCGNSSCGK